MHTNTRYLNFRVVLISHKGNLYKIKTHQNFNLQHFITKENFSIYGIVLAIAIIVETNPWQK